MAAPPRSARRHHALSALIARRAAREALAVRERGGAAVAGIVIAHQVTQAQQSEQAVGLMLAEQDIDREAQAALDVLAFTTPADLLAERLDQARVDADFARIVASLVQASGRVAESVATTVRPRIGHVRYLSPPSCSRCAVLAGRVYRYSDGFLRHPNCDCVMIPTTIARPDFIQDPVDLMQRGLVAGLSKADQQAVADGADFSRVVNVRLRSAGLTESGLAIKRAGRLTPEAIYRTTSNRDEAIEALARFGYVR